MRIEGIALEYHGHVPILRVDVVDERAIDKNLALGDIFQPHDHVEQRRLPATRGANEDKELPVANDEAHVFYGGRTVEALGRSTQLDLGHGLSLEGAGGESGHDTALE